MNLRRYQISESIYIDTPVEQAYAVASDPKLVPSYAQEIDRIEIVERLNEHRVLVKSYLKLAGFTWSSFYQFHYRRPTHYSGVQEILNSHLRRCTTAESAATRRRMMGPNWPRSPRHSKADMGIVFGR